MEEEAKNNKKMLLYINRIEIECIWRKQTILLAKCDIHRNIAMKTKNKFDVHERR